MICSWSSWLCGSVWEPFSFRREAACMARPTACSVSSGTSVAGIQNPHGQQVAHPTRWESGVHGTPAGFEYPICELAFVTVFLPALGGLCGKHACFRVVRVFCGCLRGSWPVAGHVDGYMRRGGGRGCTVGTRAFPARLGCPSHSFTLLPIYSSTLLLRLRSGDDGLGAGREFGYKYRSGGIRGPAGEMRVGGWRREIA